MSRCADILIFYFDNRWLCNWSSHKEGQNRENCSTKEPTSAIKRWDTTRCPKGKVRMWPAIHQPLTINVSHIHNTQYWRLSREEKQFSRELHQAIAASIHNTSQPGSSQSSSAADVPNEKGSVAIPVTNGFVPYFLSFVLFLQRRTVIFVLMMKLLGTNPVIVVFQKVARTVILRPLLHLRKGRVQSRSRKK